VFTKIIVALQPGRHPFRTGLNKPDKTEEGIPCLGAHGMFHATGIFLSRLFGDLKDAVHEIEEDLMAFRDIPPQLLSLRGQLNISIPLVCYQTHFDELLENSGDTGVGHP